MQTPDTSYIQENERELTRMRALVQRLTDDQLRTPVNEHWTVAGVLGHIAFWDARSLYLVDKLERSIPFIPDDVEHDNVDWVNDSTRPLIHAIEPRAAAQLALRLAGEIDTRVAAMDPARMWPNDETSLLNAFRSRHRAEHLDEIEAALAAL
jgi:hypothetical protein